MSIEWDRKTEGQNHLVLSWLDEMCVVNLAKLPGAFVVRCEQHLPLIN
jgi:hypothetical protein